MGVIKDGQSGHTVKVDSNKRVHTQSVVETEAQHAVEVGQAYNINTGNITFSAAGTLLYIKNNEESEIIVEAVAFGLGSATVSDSAEIVLIRNPSLGDLVTDATPVDMNVNRNFGSSNTLLADVYKGKSGGTVTDGVDALLFYAKESSRVFAATTVLLKRGSSMALTIDPKLTSGSMKVYCAAVVHIKDSASRD